jgi:hypothetical protein
MNRSASLPVSQRAAVAVFAALVAREAQSASVVDQSQTSYSQLSDIANRAIPGSHSPQGILEL